MKFSIAAFTRDFPVICNANIVKKPLSPGLLIIIRIMIRQASLTAENVYLRIIFCTLSFV